jgi:tetratricopeptide (TPR) repeat protein
MLVSDDDRDEAMRQAGLLTQLFPGNPAALVGAARIYATLGAEAEIRALLPEAARMSPVVQLELIEKLAQFILSRHPTEADLIAAASVAPDRLELLEALVKLAVTTRGKDGAVEAMSRLYQEAPGMIERSVELTGQAIAQMNHVQVEAIKQQVRGTPLEGPILLYVAQTRVKQKRITVDEGRREMQAVVATIPEEVERATAFEAQMLIEAGHLDDAAALLAPHLEAESRPLAGAVAALLRARGDRDEELAFLHRLAERQPEVRRHALERVVDILIEQGEHEEALGILDVLEREAPLEVGLLLSRASALEELDRKDEAVAALDVASRLEGASDDLRALALGRHARLLRDAGGVDDAIALYEEAVRLGPRVAWLRFGMAKAYKARERWDDALNTILDGVALAPERHAEFEDELRELLARTGQTPASCPPAAPAASSA